MKTNSTLYVGDLSLTTLESDLLRLFTPFGTINSIKIIRNPSPSINTSDCYAYINFDRKEDAKKALDALNLIKLNNKEIRVMFYTKPGSSSSSTTPFKEHTIIVKNLPLDVDSRTLHDTFTVFGDILSCKVAYDSNNISKGFGFVSYKDKLSLKKAVKFANDTNMKGSRLKVMKHVKKTERVSKKDEIESTFTNTFVKNFGDLSEQELRMILSSFGEVTSFHFPMVPGGNVPKGVAFCNFSLHDGAVNAIETLHEKSVEEIKSMYGIKREEIVKTIADENNNTGLEREMAEKDDNTTNNIITNDETKTNDETDSEDVVLVPEPFYIQRAQSKSERTDSLRSLVQKMSLEGQSFKRNLYITNIPENYTEKEIKKIFLKFGGTITNFKMKKDTNSNKQYCYICYSTADEAVIALEKGNDLYLDGNKLNVTYFKTKKERERSSTDDLSLLYKGYNPYEINASSMMSAKYSHNGYLDKRQMGGDLFNLVLSMAGIFQDDWKRMGLKDEYSFADKITKALLERPSGEVRNMMGLGNVLSKNITDILNEIRKKD